MSPLDVEQALADFGRVRLVQGVTPVGRLRHLSKALGRQIYCKRDDLTGFAFGGNKARKLEFLIANARRAKVDTIIAVGAAQSNFCRVAAAAASRYALGCHLVLGGTKPVQLSGNLLLDQMLGAHMTFCASDDWNVWQRCAEDLANELRQQGRTVYLMPVGGSTPMGALGYVAAFAELLRDAQRMRTSFDHIFVASSTGGTQAGLLVGKALSAWPGHIIGISVAKPKVTLANAVLGLAQETAAMLATKVEARHVLVDDEFIGPGYGRPDAACLSAVTRFAREEGIFLDRVYTGKAAAALLSYLEDERIDPGHKVLLWHTGGQVELFAHGEDDPA